MQRCFLLPAVGEDVALALELQCRGHASCYLHDCLAVGEVPTSIRAICMQKSRLVLESHGSAIAYKVQVWSVSGLCRLHVAAQAVIRVASHGLPTVSCAHILTAV